MNCNECKNRFKHIAGGCLPLEEFIFTAGNSESQSKKLNAILNTFYSYEIKKSKEAFEDFKKGIERLCVDCEVDTDFMIDANKL